jgi:hypothetical protein
MIFFFSFFFFFFFFLAWTKSIRWLLRVLIFFSLLSMSCSSGFFFAHCV